VPQDVVRRRDMEEELGNTEGQEQRAPGERSLRTVSEPEDDIALGRSIDFFARQALNEINRRGDPRLQFGDARFAAGKVLGIAAGQQRAGDHGMAVGFAHLLSEIIHGGMEPHVKQYRWIDPACVGIGLRAVEKRREIVEV